MHQSFPETDSDQYQVETLEAAVESLGLPDRSKSFDGEKGSKLNLISGLMEQSESTEVETLEAAVESLGLPDRSKSFDGSKLNLISGLTEQSESTEVETLEAAVESLGLPDRSKSFDGEKGSKLNLISSLMEQSESTEVETLEAAVVSLGLPDRSKLFDGEKVSVGIPDNEIRMIIIGKTGAGKSSTANTICREKVFPAAASAKGVTQNCCMSSTTRFGKSIVIVDTPGLFDGKVSQENIKSEMGKCIGMTAPGFHAFLLVVSIGRFTEEELNTVKEFENTFGPELYDYMVVVFTKTDSLDEEQTVESYVQNELTEDLKRIIGKSQNRFIGINNRSSNEVKDQFVEHLLDMIVSMNHGRTPGYYTNSIYKQAEKVVRERIEKKRQEEEKRRDDEIKNAAEQKLQDELGHLEKRLDEDQKKKIAEITERFEKTITEERQKADRIQEQMNQNIDDLKIKVQKNSEAAALEKAKLLKKLEKSEMKAEVKEAKAEARRAKSKARARRDENDRLLKKLQEQEREAERRRQEREAIKKSSNSCDIC